MKKYLFFAFCLFSFVGTKAQIGINTKTPLGLFHVDPKNDTSTNGSTNYSDDVIVTNDGKVGIGLVNPTEKLHVDGNVSSEDMTLTHGKHHTEGNTSVLKKSVIKDANATNVATNKVALDITSSTSFTNSFRTGYRQHPSDTQQKYILSNNSEGVATQGNLKFSPIVLNGAFVKGPYRFSTNYDTGTGATYNYRYIDITANEITLTKGKWLILAKFLALGSGPHIIYNDTGVYLKIYKRTSSDIAADAQNVNNSLSVSTAFPEVGGRWYTIPQIVYLAVIEEPTTIRIAAKYGTKHLTATCPPVLISQNLNQMDLVDMLPDKGALSKVKPYFTAIQLDDNA